MKKIEPVLLSCLAFAGMSGCDNTEKESEKPINILLITVDDMNYNSIGAYGCKVPNTTPNIDQLSQQGKRFTNAHVQVAVSQPCRNSIATGMYPHKSGLEGFFQLPDSSNDPLVYEVLKEQGFLTGILGKVWHSTSKPNFEWDLSMDMDDLGHGRDPELYYKYCKEFFARVKQEGKPFYFMTNAHDPHRPFNDSDQEIEFWGEESTVVPSKIFQPEEVEVPAFLPDIPNVRLEIAEYYSSVRRADDVVGMVLKALQEAELTENTLIVFMSDHGMALPFAKTNCYLNSTKTPLMIVWPGVVEPNTIDSAQYISTIDFLPTFLEINHVDIPEHVDGISFAPLLKGEEFTGRELMFTQFFETAGGNAYPMRTAQNKKYGYIFSPWSDGERIFKNESQVGRTFKAMKEAAKNDSAIAERVDLFVHRKVEEFYDFEKDPDALHNLIDDPNYQEEVEKFRNELENWMITEGDDALEAFIHKSDSAALSQYVLKEHAEAKERKKGKH